MVINRFCESDPFILKFSRLVSNAYLLLCIALLKCMLSLSLRVGSLVVVPQDLRSEAEIVVALVVDW